MIVLLFSVMAGLAALARGVLFTAAVCLALFASVSVLFGSLRLARAVGGPTWIPGALAILAFVLVIGGPAYLLAIRADSALQSATPDDRGSDDAAGDTPTGDSDGGESARAVDEGATPASASPVDAGASEDIDDSADSDDRDDSADSDDHPPGSDGSRARPSDTDDAHPKDPSDGAEPSDVRDGDEDGDGDGASLGTPGG